MKPLVITHKGCDDGYGARFVFWHCFGDEAEYREAQPNDPPPADVAGRAVYVADLSYRRADVLALIAATRGRFVLLDHHAAAEPELAGVVDEAYTRSAAGGLDAAPVVVFDQGKSGAMLAWEFACRYGLVGQDRFEALCGDGTVPPLVEYVQDRDLWSFALPDSKAVTAWLRTHDRDVWAWSALNAVLLNRSDRSAAVSKGQAVLAYQDQLVARHVRHAAPVVIAGHTVPAVNCTALHSEVGEALSEGQPFAATWFERADGCRVWSLRSRKGGIDVSEIAKRLGGGGHRAASGFTRPAGEPVAALATA